MHQSTEVAQVSYYFNSSKELRWSINIIESCLCLALINMYTIVKIDVKLQLFSFLLACCFSFFLLSLIPMVRGILLSVSQK